MCSLKSLDIQLTDIWTECQKELIEMRDKVLNLKECLKTSEAINRHLNRCNETLVAIIEKCKINYNDNKEIIVLINAIKEEENCIQKENEVLKTFKAKNRDNFDDHKVSDLITNWNECKQLSHSNESIPIQTTIDVTSDEKDINCDVNRHLDLGSDLKEDLIEAEIEAKSDVLSNCDNWSQLSDANDGIDDVIDGNGSQDNTDSDFELSSKSRRKRNQKKSKIKIVTKKRERLKSSSKSVVPLKVKNNYICDQNDCQFSCSNKNVLNSHLKTHGIIQISEKQKRIDALVMCCKVDDQYICNETDCQFKSSNKRIFYRHKRLHINPNISDINRKSRSERGLKTCRVAKCVATPDNPRPYVCDWPGCEMRFKRSNYLRNHKYRIHLNEKTFVCEWPGCGYSVFDSHHSKLHRMTHTNEKPLKCDWPACEFKCIAQWSLVAHKRKHTGEKPYECPWPDCNYRCSQPCTMISHKRKHTGEKPYICEVKDCCKRFASLAGIHIHRKQHNKPIRIKTNNKSLITD